MARFIHERFVPVRVHVRGQPDDFKRLSARYNALWTPTLLELDPDGEEQHRIEGFLPADDLLSQLTLGLGHSAFKHGEWDEAERHFRQVIERYPWTESAAEALYWSGVARYKRTGDASALTDTARAFSDRFPDTSWAKKASVWAA